MDVHDINLMMDSFSPTGTFQCRSEPTKTAPGCVPNRNGIEYENTCQINTLLSFEVSKDKPALQDCFVMSTFPNLLALVQWRTQEFCSGGGGGEVFSKFI